MAMDDDKHDIDDGRAAPAPSVPVAVVERRLPSCLLEHCCRQIRISVRSPLPLSTRAVEIN